MDRGLVVRTGFRVARAECHVERPTDLFIEQDVACEPVDVEVCADCIFAQKTRTGIRFKHLDQVSLILFSLCYFYATAVECELRSFDGHTTVDRGIRKLHPAVDRV